MPRPARWAANLAIGLACYAGGMAVLLVPVELFVGPHILAGAAVHGLLAAALFAAGRGLARRSGRARWLLMGVSALGVVAIPALLVTGGPADRSGWIFFGAITLYFGVMLGAASRPSAAAWCSSPSAGAALPTLDPS